MVKLNNSNNGILSLMLICIIIAACSNTKQKDRDINSLYEPSIYGKWQMIDWNGEGKPSLDISLNFDNNGEYTDSRSDDAIWNYEYIAPDSLILYHHGAYEERYKILTLSEDSMTIKLSESFFHAVDNGKSIETPYGDDSMPIYTYIRSN